jgi:7,8-dihydropterin-6-yl-methyl-4-(beta-D-ribofuranosyl)aminobenzene 5'-phosphate synthase
MTRLTVIYDNEVYVEDIGLVPHWGLSCLIENEHGSVLFDTGGDGRILLHNASILGIDISRIAQIVISHEHSDHSGGVSALVERSDRMDIFRLERDPKLHAGIQIITGSPARIIEGIETTGPITGGTIPEQALIIQGKSGSVVLTGCSHPGVDRILAMTRQVKDFKGLVGGFHDLKDLSMLSSLSLICPLHCTRKKKRILEHYPITSIAGGVGRVLEI